MHLKLDMYRLPQKELESYLCKIIFKMLQSISNKKMLEDFNIGECFLHRVFVYLVNAHMNVGSESNWKLG